MAPSPAVFPGSRALAAVTMSLPTACLEITSNLPGSPEAHLSFARSLPSCCGTQCKLVPHVFVSAVGQ